MEFSLIIISETFRKEMPNIGQNIIYPSNNFTILKIRFLILLISNDSCDSDTISIMFNYVIVYTHIIIIIESWFCRNKPFEIHLISCNETFQTRYARCVVVSTFLRFRIIQPDCWSKDYTGEIATR